MVVLLAVEADREPVGRGRNPPQPLPPPKFVILQLNVIF